MKRVDDFVSAEIIDAYRMTFFSVSGSNSVRYAVIEVAERRSLFAVSSRPDPWLTYQTEINLKATTSNLIVSVCCSFIFYFDVRAQHRRLRRRRQQ